MINTNEREAYWEGPYTDADELWRNVKQGDVVIDDVGVLRQARYATSSMGAGFTHHGCNPLTAKELLDDGKRPAWILRTRQPKPHTVETVEELEAVVRSDPYAPMRDASGALRWAYEVLDSHGMRLPATVLTPAMKPVSGRKQSTHAACATGAGISPTARSATTSKAWACRTQCGNRSRHSRKPSKTHSPG